MHRLVRDESGIAMGLAVVLVVVIGVMGAGLLVFVRNDLEAVVTVNQGQRAFEAADAGVQAAKSQLNEDSCPESYGVESEDCESEDSSRAWHEEDGMNIEGLSQGEARESSAQVLIEANSDESFTVTSTGEYGDARRKIEAVFEEGSGLQIPEGYYTEHNIRLQGAVVSSVSLFAREDVTVKGATEFKSTRDRAYERWAETDDEYSYDNPFNSEPRDSALVGIGAGGEIDADEDVVGEGSRSYDDDTEPEFVISDGDQGDDEITFPFDPEDQIPFDSDAIDDSGAMDTLRRKAKELDKQDENYDYYHGDAEGTEKIEDWPENSTPETVVFYDFEDDYSGGNKVETRGNALEEGCSEEGDGDQGVIVVNNGNFELTGNNEFNGIVIVRGGDSNSEGTYLARGNSCLQGYANASGEIDLGGTADGQEGEVEALGDLPAFGDRIQMTNWRELYE